MHGGCRYNTTRLCFCAGLLSHHALKVGQQTGDSMDTLFLVCSFSVIPIPFMTRVVPRIKAINPVHTTGVSCHRRERSTTAVVVHNTREFSR